MAVTQIPKWTLGDRLRKARLNAGIRSHKEMAKKLGVSEDTVKRWEGDKYAPTRGYVLGWAVECGVDPRWLSEGVVTDAESGTVFLQSPGQGLLFFEEYLETVTAA